MIDKFMRKRPLMRKNKSPHIAINEYLVTTIQQEKKILFLSKNLIKISSNDFKL